MDDVIRAEPAFIVDEPAPAAHFVDAAESGMPAAAAKVMLMPPISRYMTRQPWTIGSTARLAEARTRMREHGVRHLPVVDGSEVVGIVSERDVQLLLRLVGGDPEATVADAMTSPVFTVDTEEALDRVVEAMAARRLGSAVIVDRAGTIAGIFTTVDGMQALADVLQRATV